MPLNVELQYRHCCFTRQETQQTCPRFLPQVSPQARFHLLLKERKYLPRNFSSKRSAYYNEPTEHQLASYGSAILDVVRQNRTMDLRQMLQAGLSPNACNQHGESLLHMVCRHGKAELFRILVAFDVDFQVCDDYGRTPMHDVCWASSPCFEIASCLLRADPAFLFLYDARGSLPLSYCTKSNWPSWRVFLEENVDSFFPAHAKQKSIKPYLCTLKPHCRPVPNPKNCISSNMAKLVANGSMTPYEAMAAMIENDDESTVACSCSEFESDEEEDDDDDSSISDDDSESYLDDSEFDSDEEDELYKIVGGVGKVTLGTIEED